MDSDDDLTAAYLLARKDADDEIKALRAEVERLREALFAIVCNTEPSAIKHRDYDHLANAIYVWASAALGTISVTPPERSQDLYNLADKWDD